MSLSSLLFGPTRGNPAIGTSPEGEMPERGLSGFLGRVFNPTNGLGQFGNALLMAGGTKLGDAAKYAALQRQQQSENALQTEYRKAQIAKLQAGPEYAPSDLQKRYEYLKGVRPDLADAFLQNQADPTKAAVQQNPDGTMTLVPYRASQFATPPGSLAPPPAPSPGLGANMPPALPADIAGAVRSSLGVAPTSGYRSQAEQDALVARGVTRATRSSHTDGNAVDIPPLPGMTDAQLTAKLADAGLPVNRIIRESGKGRNQGTGPHLHVEGPWNGGLRPNAAPKGPNHAALLAEAQDAIARGADPVAVQARLRKLGVK